MLDLDVKRAKSKMDIIVGENRNMTVQLRVNLHVIAYEYAQDHLREQRILREINQRLSKEFTHQAKIVLQKMQKANHDGLGV
ncbi:Ger(x)C family spore germination C-terminal domain-containing protein [Brevibacillus sp. MER 51]|uniref:Ger(x)C family spore germination C-terminal domain-containing protein n=1 Tax=Brevibacillus sp. MER 51 TaxID=2939560 RepID=UPI0033416731